MNCFSKYITSVFSFKVPLWWLVSCCVWGLLFCTDSIVLLQNMQERVSLDSKFALGQVTSVPKEQNLPTLFNEGENSQVVQSLSIPEWYMTTGGSLCFNVYSDVTCSTGSKKRLCAKHHVDVRGYPHVGRIQHAYFRRWSLSCRQSQTQVGMWTHLLSPGF